MLFKSGESEGKKIPRNLKCGASCLLLFQAGMALAYLDHTVILKPGSTISIQIPAHAKERAWWGKFVLSGPCFISGLIFFLVEKKMP